MEKEDVLARLKIGEPLLWTNPERPPVDSVLPGLPLQYEDILAAADRLARFAPLLADLFPELEESRGRIESDLQAIPVMEAWMNQQAAGRLKGRVMIKADHDLPVGSLLV